MKDLLIYLRDKFVSPYCYALQLLGSSEKQLQTFFKSVGCKIPHGLHKSIQYKYSNKFAFICVLEHGVCTEITLLKWIKKTGNYKMSEYVLEHPETNNYMNNQLNFCKCLSPDFTAIQREGEQNYYYCPECGKCWNFQGVEVSPEWLPEFRANMENSKEITSHIIGLKDFPV